MYNVSSKQAEEFIDHQEILDTLDYAHTNKDNRALIESLLEKAASCKGLSHREAALLLECDQPDLTERIFHLAREIKQKLYGNRIVMFAPLYLSNYCVNGCVYCPYHAKNRTIARKKLSQEEIRREVVALQDMGHKRLALEAGEDPLRNPIDYILESIQTIYGIHHKNGAIRRVNVNIAATTVENYRRLRDAGIGTYILFQETYHKGNYETLHPTGPKSKYSYHTEAMDRAMEGGIDDVGIGVLFGLNTYRYDFVGLLMHAEHLEAAFECDQPDLTERIFHLAREIKQKLYGNRIVMFAPLYLSNYCVNGCVYCPYHAKNRTIARKKLSQEEIRREVVALQDMGHKRLALEAGEDPLRNPIDYILESIQTIYGIHHKNGAIRRVNVNIAATTVENYRRLRDAGIGTYILFQETYHKGNYETLHPTGPKSKYSYHTEAMDRAMEGGIDDVGIGVLFGLNTYRYDFVGLLMHAEHLEAAFGVGPHTISVPRICPADDIETKDFPNAISDEMFCRLVAVIRIAVPYTGMIISTRESEAVRRKVLELGISQISGGSRTSVGGYAVPETKEENSAQFDISDRRTLDEVVNWLLDLGHIPSFCTACYREGRTGDRFMSLVKRGQIANCCQPNALMTLKEYLEDYASPETREKGIRLIHEEMERIPNPKIREIALRNLHEIEEGKRDFRF